MKRKAIFLESDDHHSHHTPSSPPSMTFSSSTTSSPDSMNSEPFHSSLSTYNYHLFPASNASWLHSRTRKRVRDNRPDEMQIHADTVRRLFDAQRPHHHAEDDMMMMDGVEQPSYTPPVEMYYQDSSEPHTPATDELSLNMGHPFSGTAIEANQRSLHDFFQRRVAVAAPIPLPQPLLLSQPSHSRTPSATSLSHLAARPPTPQEISAGAPAPVLRERSSMGVLGGLNAPSPGSVEAPGGGDMEVVLLAGGGGPGGNGGYLPCDFRREVVEVVEVLPSMAMMVDAMVMG